MLTKKRTNPLFNPETFRLVAGEERAERALQDPNSVDLLVWNVFSTLETHRDARWLAGRMQMLAGPAVREPVRLSLWVGEERGARLEPPASYVNHIRQRAQQAGGDDATVAEFAAPITVPVLLDSPDVVGLIDAVDDRTNLGHGGRERLVELIDVAMQHARRVGKAAAVGMIYTSGTAAAAELSPRISALRKDNVLAGALPHRKSLPPVVLREMSWQQLLRVWQSEVAYLNVSGQPVRQFLQHCRERHLL